MEGLIHRSEGRADIDEILPGLLEKWGIAVFYDTGNAMRSFSGSLEEGAGVGLRWVSPIGPIRADAAWALTEPGTPVRFHLTVGPDL